MEFIKLVNQSKLGPISPQVLGSLKYSEISSYYQGLLT
jgi:hypothetical protein